MTEALAESAQAPQAASVRPAPFAAENAVVHWLQLSGKPELPETLPEPSLARLHSLYPDAVAEDMSIEDLLRRADADIRTLPPTRVTDAQRYIAGFNTRALQAIAPEYGKAVLALRRRIRARLATAAITTVNAPDTVVTELPDVQATEKPAVADFIPQAQDKGPESDSSVVSVVPDLNLPELTTVSEDPRPAIDPEAAERQLWTERFHGVLRLVLSQPEEPVVTDISEDVVSIGEASQRVSVALEKVTEEASSDQEASVEVSVLQPDTPREPETIELSRDIVQTLEVAQRLFGHNIAPEYALVFREFMTAQGFELFRALHQLSSKGVDKIELAISSVERFMNGERPGDIEVSSGYGVTVRNSLVRASVIKRLQQQLTADELARAFARYVESGTSEIEEVIAELNNRKVEQTAMREQKRPPLPKATPKPAPVPAEQYAGGEDTYTVTERSRPASYTDIIRVTGAAADEGDWRERALCAETDPESFFPEKGASTKDAKRICSSCEVAAACLKYALDHDERFGVWGGLSERERRRLKRATLSQAAVGEEDIAALSTVSQAPELRVRHLVNILSNPSDTESDIVEAALRDDRVLLGSYVDTVIRWFEGQRPNKLTRGDRSLVQRYFTGADVNDAVASAQNRVRLVRRIGELEDLIDQFENEDPLRHFINESMGFPGKQIPEPQQIEGVA